MLSISVLKPSCVSRISCVRLCRFGACTDLVLHVSEHVRTRLAFHRHGGGGRWMETAAGLGATGASPLAAAGEVESVTAIWPDDSDDVFVHSSGFLHPSTLAIASAADGAQARTHLKSLPARFDASRFGCWQHFATSADGTRVPYFLLGPRDLEGNLDGNLDGRRPTLLDGCNHPASPPASPPASLPRLGPNRAAADGLALAQTTSAAHAHTLSQQPSCIPLPPSRL